MTYRLFLECLAGRKADLSTATVISTFDGKHIGAVMVDSKPQVYIGKTLNSGAVVWNEVPEG